MSKHQVTKLQYHRHFLFHFPFLISQSEHFISHSMSQLNPIPSYQSHSIYYSPILSVYPSKMPCLEGKQSKRKEKDSLSLIKNHLSLFDSFYVTLCVRVHNEMLSTVDDTFLIRSIFLFFETYFFLRQQFLPLTISSKANES